MDPADRQCRVEVCTKVRIRTEPGYCAQHDYRWRTYGDPLALTVRARRDDATTELDVDWADVEEDSFWQRNPTHCPSGHEYTDANTVWVNTRDGRRRRHCRECKRLAYKRSVSGEKRDRTATCQTCGKKWEASKFGTLPKFCQECSVQRQRRKSRVNNAKKRGYVPKGPTYVCAVCGLVSPTPAKTGMPPKLCDVCASQSSLESKRKMWVDKNLRKYSITSERYVALAEAQGNCCAICRTTDPGGSISRWHIDHDHSCCDGGFSCGKCVRGLLCSRCNTALGLLNDDVERLRAAIRYQEDPPAKRVP